MGDWSKEKIISIDFDWVLAKYQWYKWENILWEPMEWSKEFVIMLQNSWYTPVIFTTRKSEIITQWLKDYDFPIIEVTSIKYPSWIYIDDRCLKFDWDYQKLLNDMREFKVYWENKEKNRFEDLGK